jgi:ABC-type lipoprotein release transport system permease subunit
MLSLRLGWRNLWRNGKRTAITMTAVALNISILIICFALMDGIWTQVVSNATNLTTGEAQAHAPEYLNDRSFYKSIPDPGPVLDLARRAGIPAAPRSFGFGLVSRETKSAGALFWGVDPAAERAGFDLHKQMATGSFLPEEGGEKSSSVDKPMVLGSKLARSLNAKVGSEIVTVVQGADGSLGSDTFRVVGILKSAGETLDRGAAILQAKDFSELFSSGDTVHEIAFNTRGRVPFLSLKQALAPAIHDLDFRSWQQLLPAIADMVAMFDVMIWIFGLIFFLAAGLGVLNTMLMATFERIREFGMQKAIGATPWRILLDVSVEAQLLVLLGTLAGAILAIPVALYFQKFGLDMSSLFGTFTAGGVAFDPIWKAVISPRVIVVPVVTLWGMTWIASLYPAAKAARIKPVHAMTHV